MKEQFQYNQTIEQPSILDRWTTEQLPQQYQENALILERTGLLDKYQVEDEKLKPLGIKMSKMGVINFAMDEVPDNNGYEPSSAKATARRVEYFPFPTEAQIRAELMGSKKELYETKMKQGFTRIQITPIIPLKKQIKALEQVALKHKDKLFIAKKDKDEETITQELDQNQPVWIWGEGYGANHDADLTGDLIYYPQQFNKENHQGLTKKELLQQSLNTPFPGYIIELKQADPKISRKGTSQPIHNRAQFETNKSSEDSLEDLKTKEEYQGENFTTIDSEIVSAIINLEKNQGILRDWQNQNDAACFVAGTYFKCRGYVAFFGWNRVARRFWLSRFNSDLSDSDGGVCASARLG